MNTLHQGLKALMDEGELSLERLVDGVNALLPALAPHQIRGTVRDTVDARTVRYYTTQGLLPRPSAYTGGRAHYGASHVLRLALIKKLQAEHHSLKVIRRRLEGLSDDGALAALLGAAPRPAVARATDAPARPPAEPLPRAPSPPPGGERSLKLSPGGVLKIPEAVLRDARTRAALAENLETLAAWLRATDDEGER